MLIYAQTLIAGTFRVRSSTVRGAVTRLHLRSCVDVENCADLPYMRAEDQKLNYSSEWSYVTLFRSDPLNTASS